MKYVCNECSVPCFLATTGEQLKPKYCPFDHEIGPICWEEEEEKEASE